MLKVTCTLKDSYEKETYTKKEEFDTLGDLEDFLSYNRAYIVSMVFDGAIESDN